MSEESLRTPQMSTHSNTADSIERYLREDGHQTWGFVIYRCTYSSDSDWTKFMDRFRLEIRRTLEYYNGLDIFERLALTVMEDKDILDDASTSFVREHFKQWSEGAAQREQGTGPGLAQRYRYCIQVDAEALESVIEGPEPTRPPTSGDGFVNLIWRDWEALKPGARGEVVEDPIEGCTQHDVGWMMVAYQDAMVAMYYYLRDDGDWYREYRRPPMVATG